MTGAPPRNTPSAVLATLANGNPDKANLMLSYHVNAVRPYESRTRSGYFQAIGIALLGVILGSMALTIVRAKPRPR